MTTKMALCLTVTVAFTWPQLALAQDQPKPVKMSWRFTPGLVLKFRQSVSQDQAMVRGGSVENHQYTTSYVVEQRTVSVNKQGQGTFSTKVLSAKYELGRPGKKMKLVYDSTKKNSKEALADPFVVILKATLGKEIRYTMDSRGEVSSVKGYDALRKLILKDIKDPRQRARVQQSYSNSSAREQLTRDNSFMPVKAVSKGDSWNHTVEKNVPAWGQATIRKKCLFKELMKYKGFECVHVSSKSLGIAWVYDKDLKMTYDFRDKGSSVHDDYWYSTKLGVTLKHVKKQKSETELSSKTGGQAITLIVSETTVTELLTVQEPGAKKSGGKSAKKMPEEPARKSDKNNPKSKKS